ncbi:MAG TPA: matrixin family metalloprotease [Kofleriaceae bacterium]|nr:matrixin family metalloprotease [Kofleriaceae bacterium]
MRVLGLLALAACGGTADSTIDVTHDPCAPLALVSSNASELQTAGMAGAQDLWRDHGAPSLGLRAGATVDVQFDDAADAFHGLYDDEAGIIYINQRIADQPTLSIVIAHELGHAFGLEHIEGRPSVMNPGNLTLTPNDLDRDALQAIWGSCE